MFRRMLAISCVFGVALLAAAGTWTPNNFLYKPSTGARGEAEKKTFDSGLDQVDKRLGKEIWVGDPGRGTTLQAAVTAIGNNQALLRIPAGAWSIGANLTIPANVTLKPERGAILSVATDVTLTINGGLDAGLYQVFSWAGTGKVVLGPGAVKYVHPEWWGAVPDNSTDCTGALQAALTSCYNSSNGVGTVFLSAGHYKITSSLAVPVYTSIIGVSPEKTVIEANGCNGLTFDSSPGSTSLGPKLFSGFQINGTGCGAKTALYCPGTADTNQVVENLNISDLRISNFGTGIYFRTVKWSTIEKCRLYPVHDGIEIVGQSIMNIVRDNIIERGLAEPEIVTNGDSEADVITIGSYNNNNGSVTFVKSSDQVHGGTYSSKMTGTWPGTSYRDSGSITELPGGKYYKISVWVYVPDSNTQNVFTNIVVNNNIQLGSLSTSVKNTWVNLSTIIYIPRNATSAYFRYGIANSSIGDVAYWDDFSVKALDVGINIDKTSDYNPGGTTAHNPEDAQVLNNLIYGSDVAVYLGKFAVCRIVGNDMDATQVCGVQVDDPWDGLEIEKNWIGLNGTTGLYGIRMTPLSTGPNRCLTKIEDNTIGATGTPPVYGISVEANQSANIIRNHIQSYVTHGVYLNGNYDCQVIGNVILGSTYSVMETGSINTSTITIDNNYCAMPIWVDPSSNAGHINIGPQGGPQSYYVRGKSVIPAGQTTVTTTFASLYGAPGNWADPATYYVQPVLRILAPGVDTGLGAVGGTVTSTGVTLVSTNAAPAGGRSVFWEVISMPAIEYNH